MASAVKVAVRMRPLNEREKILGSKIIVEMNTETTFLQVCTDHEIKRLLVRLYDVLELLLYISNYD